MCNLRSTYALHFSPVCNNLPLRSQTQLRRDLGLRYNDRHEGSGTGVQTLVYDRVCYTRLEGDINVSTGQRKLRPKLGMAGTLLLSAYPVLLRMLCD